MTSKTLGTANKALFGSVGSLAKLYVTALAAAVMSLVLILFQLVVLLAPVYVIAELITYAATKI